MIMGDRGTGKSTTIRALADLLDITIIKMTPSIQIQKVWKKLYETEE
jgi:Mg-chelatase subunit ChlI